MRRIPLEQLQKNDYQYPPFPSGVRAQIEFLQATFADVIPDAVEIWEDDFRRDAHPIWEIERWLVLARAYKQLQGRREMKSEEKEDTLRVLLAFTMGGTGVNEILSDPGIQALSRQQVEEIIACCVASAEAA